MGYCTVDEARAAGATGTDPVVQAAIDDATAAIQLYTADFFTPVTVTVATTIGSDSIAMLPYTTRAVTAVSVAGTPTVLDASTYSVHSSLTPGDFDGIGMFTGGYNPLINGAEPWTGGYSAFYRPGLRLAVTGEFGFDAPPVPVRKACALLCVDATVGTDAPPSGVSKLSVEGYSVEFTSARAGMTVGATGNYEVDRMLAPFCRRVRVTGV